MVVHISSPSSASVQTSSALPGHVKGAEREREKRYCLVSTGKITRVNKYTAIFIGIVTVGLCISSAFEIGNSL